MPLHKHTKTGERVRTVADSREDERLLADEAWQLVDESGDGKAKATPPRPTTGAGVTA